MLTPKILSVKPVNKYKIDVEFQDGTAGTYDLSDVAGHGVFKSWDEGDNFFRVQISADSGAITWPGDIDVDTIAVYCHLKGISPDTLLKTQSYHATHL